MIRPVRHFLWLFAALLVTTQPALAVLPDEMLANPVLEQRARDISKELRCLVCQNQSIDDSDADLARDLRVLVRERLVAGDTDQQTLNYIVDRYGDYVLLNPPLKPETYILWGSPFFLLIFAAIGVFAFYRRKKNDALTNSPQALSDAERRRLDDLLRPSQD
ncbi:MAG: cytochrome c-type biogenesis protein [Pseudomonadota bacterium]